MRQCVLLHLQRLLFHYRNYVGCTNLDPLHFLPLGPTTFTLCRDSPSFPNALPSFHTDSMDFYWSIPSQIQRSSDSLLNTMRSKRDRALNSCFQNGVDPTANHTPCALLPTALLLFTTSRGTACLVKLSAEQWLSIICILKMFGEAYGKEQVSKLGAGDY